MKAHARGGIRLGEAWGTWPSARLEVTPADIHIDFLGKHAVAKEDIEKIVFARGSFTCDIHIYHDCEWTHEPIRFFGFGALRNIEKRAIECGYPCEVRKRRFFEKGDVDVVGD